MLADPMPPLRERLPDAGTSVGLVTLPVHHSDVRQARTVHGTSRTLGPREFPLHAREFLGLTRYTFASLCCGSVMCQPTVRCQKQETFAIQIETAGSIDARNRHVVSHRRSPFGSVKQGNTPWGL